MKRRRLEGQIAAAVDQYMQLRARPGVVWFHIPNGGKRDKITGANFKREGVKAGVPDFYFRYKGHCYFLELKSDNGRLSKSQRLMQARLEETEATVGNAWGIDEAIGYVKEWDLIR